ncbi:hypothetical protein J5Y09_11980 [Roseomonas sp. PWR1]|uniref:Uncharacterized protein n=1 Tax=Roseomonas nitratireducens TaxID=2820810 RepID=A0ABS4ATD7_9PROT|nr:hypothetical protein [Neoroseomonas nitratireducens]MBP0464628.1 hypothetical protein [Neoroseomonas nitratireducens]
MRSVILLLLALGLLAPSAQSQTTSFDGTWLGRGTLLRGQASSRCGDAERNGRLTIQGGVLNIEYSTRDNVRFSGPVAADGSFDIHFGQHRFFGRIAGGAMTAQYAHPICVRDWQFRRGG